jgi:hypothetical protein
MSYQQVADGQVSPEVPINENMAALGQAFLWSHDVTADSGLVVGFSGGALNGNTVTDATLTATDNATNYVVVNRSTRALSVSTGTTAWADTATYGRIARLVFNSGVLAFHDERYSVGGIFDHSASVAAAVASVNGQAGAVSLDAADLPIVDLGGYFSGTEIEAALQEVGASLAGLGSAANLSVDIDGTLAANSDTRVPSQKAVKTYLDTKAQPYDLLMFVPGTLTGSQVLTRIVVARAVTLPANLSGSYASAITAATGATSLSLRRNGISIGSIEFAAGANTATFSFAAAVTVAAGDFLSLHNQTTADPTLANVSVTLVATR